VRSAPTSHADVYDIDPPPQLRCTVVSTCVREGRGTHFVVRGAPGARSVCASVSELCVIQSQRERRPVRDPQTCVRENNYWYKRTITHTLTYTRARARARTHTYTRARTHRDAPRSQINTSVTHDRDSIPHPPTSQARGGGDRAKKRQRAGGPRHIECQWGGLPTAVDQQTRRGGARRLVGARPAISARW
jgi:hypothetical protein